MTVAAVLCVSIGVPLAFLAAVRKLDLYASHSLRNVLTCAAVGFLAFPAAYVINNGVRDALMLQLGLSVAATMLAIKTIVAPVIEEVAKSLGVWIVVRRRDFTYFVDGAICGFAGGTAFAMVENVFYALRAGLGDSLALSVNRAFSTSLVHGTASALVGIVIGRFRFERSWRRYVALLAGWGLAIALHMGFNRVVTSTSFGSVVLLAAIVIGTGGVGAIACVMLLGLRVERRWIADSLDIGIGVSPHEARAVDRMRDLDKVLAPVTVHFGEAKRQAVEALLRSQARLGLKHQLAQRTAEPAQRAEIEADIAALQAEHDRLRRAVGVYCMTYVRSILPSGNTPLWDRLGAQLLDASALDARPRSDDVWSRLATRTAPPKDP